VVFLYKSKVLAADFIRSFISSLAQDLF